jgi:hypothetical protein
MTKHNGLSCEKDRPSANNGRIDLDKISTYEINGKTFIVEPVFNKTSNDTVDTILVRLMREECANN